MKQLFVALVSVHSAILTVSANDKEISTYQIEPFDRTVSTKLIDSLVQTSDTEHIQEKRLFPTNPRTVCEIELKRVNQVFQDENVPFTPLVREVVLKGPIVDRIDLEAKERFRLLNLAYGYRHR